MRTYVSVDGGMADNIRPALYGAQYTAQIIAPGDRPAEVVTIAGRYCESGDILIHDIALPRPAGGRRAGDPDGRRVHPGDGKQLQPGAPPGGDHGA